MTAVVPETESLRERADALLTLGVRAATAYGRPELVIRLERRRVRLQSNTVRVVIIGEFKAGKSSLVNAALGADLCPTDDDVATAIPTIVRNGDVVAAVGLMAADGETDRFDIPFEERLAEIREDGQRERSYTAIELTVPRAILASGLELIDTPGVGGLRSSHTAAAIAAVEDAEAAIFVTDASQEFSRQELVVLTELADRCPNVLVVLTKCDVFPDWRRIKEFDEGHLLRAGLDLPIVAVSSSLRARAVELRSDAINAESGFAELLTILRDDVAGQAELFAIDQVVHELLAVIDSFKESFNIERSVLEDPDRAAAIEAELQAATARAERLQTASARWQVTLNDGVNDLMTDVDHDLRSRLRQLMAEAVKRIEDVDPRQSWGEFTPWLEQQAAAELLANHHLLYERTDDLTRRVLDHFHLDEAGVNTPGFLDDLRPTDHDATIADIDQTGANPVKQILGGLRGSYSGLLMFGAFGGMAGIAIATPVLAGIGLLLGARQVRDERSKQLKAHRQQAQVSIRKYVEEVTFVANKAARDSVKLVQRNLRDHCATEARDVQEQIKQTLAAVRDARASENREGRLRDIDAELVRLAGLRSNVEALCD